MTAQAQADAIIADLVPADLVPYPVRKSTTPRGAANARQLRPGRRYRG